MKKLILTSFIVLSVLALSLASASFFSDLLGGRITGKVADNTDFPDTANRCTDSDLGVKAGTAGVVKVIGTFSNKYVTDSCVGKATSRIGADGKTIITYASIRENWCDNGAQKQVMNFTTNPEIGEGYCVKENVEYEGRTHASAKWVLSAAVCVEISNGIELGDKTILRNGCGKDADSNKFVTYTCNPDGTYNRSVEDCTTADGFGRCTSRGCVGNCVDSDLGGNKNIAGVVTFNGAIFKDTCNSVNNSVLEYKCVDGVKSRQWLTCGANRECLVDSASGAGYCKNKYAGATTIETLQQQVDDLQNQVDRMQTVVDELSAKLAGVDLH